MTLFSRRVANISLAAVVAPLQPGRMVPTLTLLLSYSLTLLLLLSLALACSLALTLSCSRLLSRSHSLLLSLIVHCSFMYDGPRVGQTTQQRSRRTGACRNKPVTTARKTRQAHSRAAAKPRRGPIPSPRRAFFHTSLGGRQRRRFARSAVGGGRLHHRQPLLDEVAELLPQRVLLVEVSHRGDAVPHCTCLGHQRDHAPDCSVGLHGGTWLWPVCTGPLARISDSWRAFLWSTLLETQTVSPWRRVWTAQAST